MENSLGTKNSSQYTKDSRHKPEHIAFTRFIPPRTADEATGEWKAFYRKWKMMTLEYLQTGMIELVPELAQYAVRDNVFDKGIYSPWQQTGLHDYLRQRNIGTLVITGGETDICVLATVMGAIDFGYKVVIVTDALCSVTDDCHDAILDVYTKRYKVQIETLKTDELIRRWN